MSIWFYLLILANPPLLGPVRLSCCCLTKLKTQTTRALRASVVFTQWLHLSLPSKQLSYFFHLPDVHVFYHPSANPIHFIMPKHARKIELSYFLMQTSDRSITAALNSFKPSNTVNAQGNILFQFIGVHE